MLDFLRISKREGKRSIEIYPKFLIKGHLTDLMIRGKDFYAIWDEEEGLWSTDEGRAVKIIDNELDSEYVELLRTAGGEKYSVMYMWDADSGSIDRWHKYVQKQLRDNYHPLDEKVIFANQVSKKKDYASKKLSYGMVEGDISGYDELMSTLYAPEERDKLEWAIGSIIAGDSKNIQKFIVLYGGPGTGKSTVLNIIEWLFEDYVTMFDAKELASSNNDFALEAFKNNPLVGIQHDGDLSKIEDNTKLNSIVSHEKMLINEKFKAKYESRFDTFLFMGTNKPVKITEAKSGLMRRLIDVQPSGKTLSHDRYDALIDKIKFELGAIADHCLKKYKKMGRKYYDSYVPINMMSATNDIYDFIETYYFEEFSKKNDMQLSDIWSLYKIYCDDANIKYPVNRRVLGLEMRNYYEEFIQDAHIDGKHYRNYYRGFIKDKFKNMGEKQENIPHERNEWLKFDKTKSIFDETHQMCPAQLANSEGTPFYKWDNCKTTLKDIDTSVLHYVKVPIREIVIDFDIKGEDGEKSFERNLEEATKWPETYAELSKSGSGIHLHYFYSGDVDRLSRIYDEDVEVKVFNGNSSLRRKLTKCNNIPIATISSGLPLKGEKKMINEVAFRNEKQLRNMIKSCFRKEHHGATTPEVHFIKHLLDEAYSSGLSYDVTDMRPDIITFASHSTHQSTNCMKLVADMKFKSDEPSENVESSNDVLVFYDVEVFPNLFLVNWKYRGSPTVIRMINPTPAEILELSKYKLVGFNCRRYDNHILYARSMGYSNEELYTLSQRIINGSRNSMFAEAYNWSYTDVYDFASKKQSLKKWEIELGIHHQELGFKWDEPVPEEKWGEVAEYCDNDVIATEALFEHLKGDWTARQILADISGLSVNNTTNNHIIKILLGNDRNPDLVYTDLATGERSDGSIPEYPCAFPGYENKYFESDKKYHNIFRGDDVGRGGYVYAEPGSYGNVALLDVGNMHGASILALKKFGEHTKNYKEIRDARMAIKHKEFDKAKHMFNGRLEKYLTNESDADDLQKALKLVLNSTYGIAAATFDNPLRDRRDVNNIIALRGALFMRTLQDEVRKRGYVVAHIKTDSIKIPDATPEIINFVMDFGKEYGYEFEHEATYEKMCLVNNAVYIAKYSDAEKCKQMYGYIPEKNAKYPNQWTATGAEFQHPYIFKKLFSHEEIVFKDYCETKEVKNAEIYLDFNENLPEDQHNYKFVGRIGSFVPIEPGKGGAILLALRNEKYNAVAGSKGYRWYESETALIEKKENDVDMNYFKALVDGAIESISEYCDFEQFVSDEPYKKAEPEYIDITSDELPF